MKPISIDIELNAKQKLAYEYINDKITTQILFGGGCHSGKSFLACLWLLVSCISYPSTRWLMGRSKLKTLKQTTLATFFDLCKMCNLNEEHFNYNQQLGEIHFFNGSVIILKDLFLYPSDPNFDSLGGLEITGAVIDEANQVTEKAKNIVTSRIRYRLDEYNLIPKLLMTCNPARNWVYTEFYKKSVEGVIEPYKKFIQALATDNKYTSKHYIAQLEKLDLVSRKRLLYGEWEYVDKAAIMKYDNIVDSFKDYAYTLTQHTTKPKYYISCDVARKGKDKAVIMVWDNYKVIEVIVKDISLTNEIVAAINSLKSKYKINNRSVVVDGDGVGGGVVDYLPNCIDFVNNSKALGGENYQNLKTQCYFKLAELIDKGEIEIYGFNVEQRELLSQELAAIQRKNIDKDGRLQISSKDMIKAIIGRSPDYSDALMMRMYFSINPYSNRITFRVN